MFRLVFLLFALPGVLAAQTLERSFGLELSPQLSERRVSGVGSVTFTELDRIDSLEQGTFGYGIGLLYENRVERIGYTTGLRYTRNGYETLDQAVPGQPGRTFRDEISAHYLALPFEVNFYQDVTDKDRVLFVLGVGLQYHLGTRTRRTTLLGGDEVGSELVDEDINYRGLVTSLVTGVGYDRKLSNDWAIRFQPTFQFFLNGNIRPEEDTRANRNYYQLGLRIIIRRLFI